MKSLHGRSRGAVLLARTGLTHPEIAARVDVSRALVSHWAAGRRLPTVPNRKALLDEFQIPVEAWDEPAAHAAPPKDRRTSKKRPSSANGEIAVRAEASKWKSVVEMARKKLDEGAIEGATPEFLIDLARKASDALQNLGKCSGEISGITEATIVRHPAWKKLELAIEQALHPWPEAMRAVGEALQELARDTAA